MSPKIIAIPFFILLIVITTKAQQSISDSGEVLKALESWLALDPESGSMMEEQAFARQALTEGEARQVTELLWKEHIRLIKETFRAEWQQKEFIYENYHLKFEYKIFGEKPKDGRSLYISLHGGGGAPAEVNEQQWQNQIRLYEPGEGAYLAPRAPTDSWNMWHQEHMDIFLDRIIQAAIVFLDVNPDKVYLMGYSAGGDGVYQLAPRMADRWAAAAMMAGHPNDASPLGLRNIGFTIHMGANDSAYSRNEKAREWKQLLAELHKKDPKGYQHYVKLHPGRGHWMHREDTTALDWMAGFMRNPLPDQVVWKQDDVSHDRFYWLGLPKQSKQKQTEITASLKGQEIRIEATKEADTLLIYLNDTMLSLDMPVTLYYKGEKIFEGKVERNSSDIWQSIRKRGDRKLIFSAHITIVRGRVFIK